MSLHTPKVSMADRYRSVTQSTPARTEAEKFWVLYAPGIVTLVLVFSSSGK